jgi:two-component system chemotaxis sensor kinase CheA
MDNKGRKSTFSLIEELASSAVSFNAASKEAVEHLTGQLKNFEETSKREGFQAISEAVPLMAELISPLSTNNPELFRELLFCWIAVIQEAVASPSALSLDCAQFSAGIKEQFSGIIVRMGGKFRPAQEAPDFVPEVPVLDLSEGPAILQEFVTESTDHLENAEESLLTLESVPGNLKEIDKIFRSFHTIKGMASFLNLEDIRILSHDTETMMDFVRKGALALNEDITGAILQSIDALRRLIGLLKEQAGLNGVLKSPYFDVGPVIRKLRDIIRAGEAVGEPLPPKKIGDILIEKDIISEQELSAALKQQESGEAKKVGEILVEMGVATPAQLERGLTEQKSITAAGESIKISVKKHDDLVDTMGELVITGTQVINHPEISVLEDTRLRKEIAQLDRIIRDIQNISMAVRLMPIRPVFQKMTRLARDLSQKAAKKIEVKVSGEDTEIDKNITELVSDPLVHMVRNAIDHGIEPLELRRKRGKPDTGVLSLNAYHKGGNIIVEVVDDGGGLDKEKILKRAIERGLARQGENLSDDEINRFIFEPGFSTADQVTDVSGRGVGMDVVKRNIEQLQGRIEIHTECGRGTKFSIRLPLTLAIIEGIVVKVGGERYILPIFVIVEFICPKRKDLSTIADKSELIMAHGKLFPVVRLDRFFNVRYRSETIEDMTGCLVNSDYGQICILIDELIGQQQVVIKNLGEYLKGAKGLSGATILGDGRVGLILDVNSIAGLSRQQEKARFS